VLAPMSHRLRPFDATLPVHAHNLQTTRASRILLPHRVGLSFRYWSLGALTPVALAAETVPKLTLPPDHSMGADQELSVGLLTWGFDVPLGCLLSAACNAAANMILVSRAAIVMLTTLIFDLISYVLPNIFLGGLRVYVSGAI
jgi:hypothetical protein